MSKIIEGAEALAPGGGWSIFLVPASRQGKRPDAIRRGHGQRRGGELGRGVLEEGPNRLNCDHGSESARLGVAGEKRRLVGCTNGAREKEIGITSKFSQESVLGAVACALKGPEGTKKNKRASQKRGETSIYRRKGSGKACSKTNERDDRDGNRREESQNQRDKKKTKGREGR